MRTTIFTTTDKWAKQMSQSIHIQSGKVTPSWNWDNVGATHELHTDLNRPTITHFSFLENAIATHWVTQDIRGYIVETPGQVVECSRDCCIVGCHTARAPPLGRIKCVDGCCHNAEIICTRAPTYEERIHSAQYVRLLNVRE